MCPERQNVTNNIVCTACGGIGHIAKDCRSKRPGMGGAVAADSQAKIDEEYMSLMAELGEGPEPSAPAGENNAKNNATNNMPVIPNIPRNNFSNLFESKPAPRSIMPAAPVNQAPIPGPPPPPQPPNVWPSAPPPPIPSLMSNPPIPGLNGAPLNPVLPPNPPGYSNTWNHQPCPPGENPPDIPGVPGTNSWNTNPPPIPNAFQNNSFNCFPPIPNLTLPPPPPPPS